jgi:hypothetical protein
VEINNFDKHKDSLTPINSEKDATPIRLQANADLQINPVENLKQAAVNF